MSTIAIRKKVSFAAVPDVLFSLPMKPAAILVLAWALGRPDGWSFHIEHMLKILNYSENQWKTAKKELMSNGFFNQKKYRDDQGKICWVNEFCDDPLWKFGTTPPSIPKKTIPDKSMDGGPSRGKGGDIAEDVSSKVLKAVVVEGAQDSAAAAFLDQNLKSKQEEANNLYIDELIQPLLKNALDRENWASLKADFTGEVLFSVMQEIIKAGKKPFASTISKKLRAAASTKPSNSGGASFAPALLNIKKRGELTPSISSAMQKAAPGYTAGDTHQ